MDKEIKGYCVDCKDPIYEGEEEVKYQDNIYHADCFKQMNTFYDKFDVE